ncbi:hypothetical protein HNQ02_001482 [Flavobacterium sp. 7E]|uniref:hypothetical protein n=1 Tax=unclassified Flavobacterium TaxID=196869 RepID=UPI00156F4DFA|nr:MULTISPECIES: hypothetical protein [unclassified Flavobacterium]MBE0392677.1 hypothetical protein [Flavobacterium sp. PL002]NRS88568.1 hypothetical protein [Flavobacterium sp. 7E]
MKIDRNAKRIYVTLRVNLTDGGEEGLSCYEKDYDPDPKFRQMGTVCPWDKIPASEISLNNPIIKVRTRKFQDLEKLALKGIKKYWSREHSYSLKLNNEKFEVTTTPINTIHNSLNPLNLIYNTNGNWGRSGNAGILGKIYYNIGYCNFLAWYEPSFFNDWGYLDVAKHKVDEDFMYTSAHELGHSILKAYGSTLYSFTHDDSSKIWQTPNGKKSYIKEKSLGEINLMHYYKDDPHQSQYDYNLIIAQENDVLGLIWLTKIKIK